MTQQEFMLHVHNNKIVRIIVFPFECIRRRWVKHQYGKTEYSKYIKSLKNVHLGQRCFIIGNGPSLTVEDLEKLKGEIVFASNRIYHIFNKTDWRPTYYLSTDMDGLVAEKENVKKYVMGEKFVNYKAYKNFKDCKDIHFLYPYGKFYISRNAYDVKTLTEDISKFITPTYTITATAIEMAIFMGFDEIYLLGVDHKYKKQRLKDGTILIDSTVKTYFDGMKDSNGENGDGISIQNIDGSEIAYKACLKFATKKNVKIYNVTRGGYLDIFQRKEFDEII